MAWYYAKNGERQGPVEETELHNLVNAGTIAPDDLVWTPEFGNDWRAARDVPGLIFPLLRSVQPPPPPPPVYATAAQASAGSAQDGPFRSATHNRDLMSAARAALRERWGLAIGVLVLMLAIQFGLSLFSCIPLIGMAFSVASWLISGALALGVAGFYLKLSRTGNSAVEEAFSGFRRFGVAFLTSLLIGIFVFLWMLLLIVPGIIAGIRYSQAWFILADNPKMDALDAIHRSKQMMRGNKWKYFCLQWRFFGWALLCMLTLGIGFLWLGPYMSMSNTKFYDDLKPE